MKKILVYFGTLSAFFLFLACSQLPERDLKSNPITDCTGGPHCVTTRTPDSNRKIKPISFENKNADFQSIAVSVINSMPRSHIVRGEKNYVYAEFTSAVLRFVDDFEVYWDSQTKLVDIRSSSRIGYDDLGINQKRTEKFQELFFQKTK